MYQLSIDNWDFQGKPLVLDQAFMGSSKLKRKRGVVLTMRGYQRPWHTQLESEPQSNHRESYIYGELSEKIGLSSGSIQWMLNREEGVDRQSVQRLFRALTYHQNPLIIQCMILLQFALGMMYLGCGNYPDEMLLSSSETTVIQGFQNPLHLIVRAPLPSKNLAISILI